MLETGRPPILTASKDEQKQINEIATYLYKLYGELDHKLSLYGRQIEDLQSQINSMQKGE